MTDLRLWEQQAWQEYEQTACAPPVWDVEAGLGPRTAKTAATAAQPSTHTQQDAKLMDTADINSFLAPCPSGPSSQSSPKAAGTVLVAEAVLVSECADASGVSRGSVSPTPGCAAGAGGSPAAAQAAVAVDIDGWDGERSGVPSTQGRAYDLDKVDEKLRKRLLKNRLSAERSRQRKQAHVEALEFELSCCRSENEHLKKKVATLEAQVASLSLNTSCKPASSFSHQELQAAC